MASSYALPMSADSQGNHHGHSHGHSFSASHLSPASAKTKNSFSTAPGHNVRKAASNGNILYTHDETSRENSPYPSPDQEHDHSPFQTNIDAVHANGHNHTHSHDHSHEEAPQREVIDLDWGWSGRDVEDPEERTASDSHVWGRRLNWKDGDPIPAPILSSLPVRSRSTGRWDGDGM